MIFEYERTPDRAEIERLALIVLEVANRGSYPAHPTDPTQLYCSMCGVSAPVGPLGLHHAANCPVAHCQTALRLGASGGVTTGPLAQCERCGLVQIASELTHLSADGVDQYACLPCHEAYERQEQRQAKRLAQ